MVQFRNIFLLLFSKHILVFTLTAQVPLLPRDTSVKGPQTFAIILGISKYKFVKPLKYADKDAELFRDYLKSPAGGSVKDENIYCLLNEKANNSNFWGKGFQWLKSKNLRQGDKLFFYLAGHGDAIDEDQFFFLGYDCNPAGDKNNYLVSGAIQLFNLKKKIAAETAKGVDVVFIMDACRSNELPGGTEGQSFLNTAISEKKVGEIIMLATGAGQEALEDETIGNGHGLFTYYLVDGLTGLADSKTNPDRNINFKEIESYVALNVPQVAQQRFQRKQDPYFCCSEKSEQIISRVDSLYLINWLKRKATERIPGNSVFEFEKKNLYRADTALINLYNQFNRTIQDKNISGRERAALLYTEMERKYPGDPYTLDAQSTLAVTYLDFAQQKIDDYLACNNTIPQADIQEACERLHTAIDLFNRDDPDFANSLIHRLCLLKAGLAPIGSHTALQNAYGALKIHPDGAYVLNKLALLHLENRNYDSALYYAAKAVKIAPQWLCAGNTLSLVRSQRDSLKKRTPVSKRSSFGVVAGGGITMPSVSFSRSNWRQGQAIYTDSLNNITTSAGGQFNVGVFLQLEPGPLIKWRSEIRIGYEQGVVVYDRKRTPGGTESILDRQKVNRTSISTSLPVLIKFSRKVNSPYLSLGPGFTYNLNQKSGNQYALTVQSYDITAEAGFGIDIRSKGSSLVISPELKYINGLRNMKSSSNNIYSNTISTLKLNAIQLNILLRKGS